MDFSDNEIEVLHSTPLVIGLLESCMSKATSVGATMFRVEGPGLSHKDLSRNLADIATKGADTFDNAHNNMHSLGLKMGRVCNKGGQLDRFVKCLQREKEGDYANRLLDQLTDTAVSCVKECDETDKKIETFKGQLNLLRDALQERLISSDRVRATQDQNARAANREFESAQESYKKQMVYAEKAEAKLHDACADQSKSESMLGFCAYNLGTLGLSWTLRCAIALGEVALAAKNRMDASSAASEAKRDKEEEIQRVKDTFEKYLDAKMRLDTCNDVVKSMDMFLAALRDIAGALDLVSWHFEQAFRRLRKVSQMIKEFARMGKDDIAPLASQTRGDKKLSRLELKDLPIVAEQIMILAASAKAYALQHAEVIEISITPALRVTRDRRNSMRSDRALVRWNRRSEDSKKKRLIGVTNKYKKQLEDDLESIQKVRKTNQSLFWRLQSRISGLF